MTTPFVDLTVDTDENSAELAIYDGLREALPEWEEAAGGLETFLAKPWARLVSAILSLDAVVGKEIFSGFGQKIVNVPPITATAATANATLTAIDNAGYVIIPGTQFSIAANGTETYGFEAVNEVTIAPGDTATDAGELILAAVEPGEAANDLSADPVPVDALAFIESIELTGDTSGGVDAEDPDDYLNRLVLELRLLTPRPILPVDFSVLALNVAGVARAATVDAYNADTDADDEERTVSVYVVDEDGEELSSPVKDAVEAYLDALREVNFVVVVADPDYATIKANTSFTVRPGFTPADVETAVEAALTAYFQPSAWGVPLFGDATTSGGWVNQTTVYRNELIVLVDQVPGVDHVTALTLAQGAGSLATSDLTLTGAAVLTRPGVFNATAV